MGKLENKKPNFQQQKITRCGKGNGFVRNYIKYETRLTISLSNLVFGYE